MRRSAAAATIVCLMGGLAFAQSVQVRGPVDVDAPRPRGDIVVGLSLYDAPADGRLLWKSPAFHAQAFDWRWLFAGIRGPADKEARQSMPETVFAEFESGNTVFKPRQAFHRASASTDVELVFDPGAAAAKPKAVDPGAAAGREPTEDEGGISVGGGRVGLIALRPAPASTAKRASSAHEPSLDDLRLSNDLYFQALREYRTGNPSLALAKLAVARRLNPSNAEARVAEERINQEINTPPVPTDATPSAEAASQAQELYFEALRSYGKGDLGRAERALMRAAQTDPTDRGIATALIRLRREMVLAASPHVLH